MDNLPSDIPALITLISQNQPQILTFIEGFCSAGVAVIFLSLLMRWMVESDYAFATYEADLLQQELLAIENTRKFRMASNPGQPTLDFERLFEHGISRQLKVAMTKAYRYRRAISLTKAAYWAATISSFSVGFVGLLIKYAL